MKDKDVRKLLAHALINTMYEVKRIERVYGTEVQNETIVADSEMVFEKLQELKKEVEGRNGV